MFKPIDQDRVETWRIMGLLEAGELEAAIDRLRRFKTKDRDLIFMLHVSVCWALYYQNVKGETKKQLEHISVETGSVVEDMRQDLFKELKSLFFQIRSGRFEAVIEGGDEETKKLPAPAE